MWWGDRVCGGDGGGVIGFVVVVVGGVFRQRIYERESMACLRT